MMKSESFRVWSQMEPISADEALSLAVQVGYRGWGRVSPNPLVGCVIVDRNQRLLSSGAHLQLGGPHAEVEALTSLSDPKLLDGAWVYVTLEPCAHEGRTPACAKTLANLPIAGVTYLVEDPNPLVAGKGAAILRAAGKQVVHQLRESTEAELLAEVFLTNMRLRRPFVALKVATTLDGSMARRGEGSLWLTSAQAREYVHYLRAGYDTIVVGKNTVELDDPRLDVRHADFPGQKNRVVVLDPAGTAYRPDSQLVRSHSGAEVIWVLEEGVSREGMDAVEVIYAERNAAGTFTLASVLSELYEKGVRGVLLEGGSGVYASFLDQGLVDRLYLFVCPQLTLGAEAIRWTQSVKGQPPYRLEHLYTQRFGEDLLVSGRISR